MLLRVSVCQKCNGEEEAPNSLDLVPKISRSKVLCSHTVLIMKFFNYCDL